MNLGTHVLKCRQSVHKCYNHNILEGLYEILSLKNTIITVPMPIFRIKHIYATTLWTPLLKAGQALAVLKKKKMKPIYNVRKLLSL